MGKTINMIGNKYGKLEVLNFEYKKNGQPYFLCKCECGNTKIIRGSSLRYGKCKSCGCIRDKTRKNFGKRVRKHLIVDGVDYSNEEFCNVFKINAMTLNRKIKSGMSLEEIVDSQLMKILD